ncbi:hypothetical protein BGX27_005180, partial [Mortierella sp. AM989]
MSLVLWTCCILGIPLEFALTIYDDDIPVDLRCILKLAMDDSIGITLVMGAIIRFLNVND